MIALNLALGLVTAGVLAMLDTIARHLPMESIAGPLTATLVGAVAAGRFLPSLLSCFSRDRRAAVVWQGRSVLLVGAVVVVGGTWSSVSGPEAHSPEELVRLVVRACVWLLGLVGCSLSARHYATVLEPEQLVPES